jgi:dTDP-4-amino-4,6-dideoxygalactose transaminase
MDPECVEAAITPRTRAIMPVHVGGLACSMDPILAIARRHDLKVVEDAAHSLPASYRARLVGSLCTDATVFSFYATKTLVTGEGGMIVTRDPALAARCRVMRLHGIDRDAFDRYTSERPAWYYEVVAPGFKYNMTDIAAALGLQQLRRVHELRDRREEMAHRYDEALGDLPLDLPAHAPNGDLHAWHLYVMRLRSEAPVDRDIFIVRMAERGIGTSVHFIPLHRHPYWRDTYGLEAEDFPQADAAFRRAVSLPLYTRMSEDDQLRVIEAVRECLE